MSPCFQEWKVLQSPVEIQTEFNYYSKIQQADLVPSLSILLGLSVPLNNLGVIPKSFLPLWKGNSSVTSVILENRQKRAIVGDILLQMVTLVNLTRPEIFTDDYRCSKDDQIGCVWLECKTAWNASNDSAVDLCYEVVA
jgi:ethanolamine phosphate transferase 2 subunit G